MQLPSLVGLILIMIGCLAEALVARLMKKTKQSPRHSDTFYKHCSRSQDTYPTMAAGQKLYPRATVKKIIKAHSKTNLSKNVDVVVGLRKRVPALSS